MLKEGPLSQDYGSANEASSWASAPGQALDGCALIGVVLQPVEFSVRDDRLGSRVGRRRCRWPPI